MSVIDDKGKCVECGRKNTISQHSTVAPNGEKFDWFGCSVCGRGAPKQIKDMFERFKYG